MFFQTVSLIGAALVLAAYVANHRGWLTAEHRLYNALNLLGAGLLCWVAVVDRRAGFIVLEGIWAAVALPPLLGLGRRRGAA
ncbi:MAG: hypothetical protein D6701_13235 [Gemmatimonadetes bacterium]|nr:MAG: hypothetical protein D6701_13235 [Gemmatimonadota bacterium]